MEQITGNNSTNFQANGNINIENINVSRDLNTDNESSVSHDKTLFQRYNEILPERDLLYILNNDLYNNRMCYADSERFSSFCALANSVDGQFLNKKVILNFEKFTFCFFKLKSFIATHFFVVNELSINSPSDEWVLALYPDLKKSPYENKRQIYFQREKELLELIEVTADSYKNFRKIIKTELHL